MIMHAGVLFSIAVTGFLGAPRPAKAQIASLTDESGRRMFVNAEPPALKPSPVKPRTTIYMSGEISFLGKNRPAVSLDRDGVEKLVREARLRRARGGCPQSAR